MCFEIYVASTYSRDMKYSSLIHLESKYTFLSIQKYSFISLLNFLGLDSLLPCSNNSQLKLSY